VKIRYSTCATAATRSGSCAGEGGVNRAPACRSRAFARLMRWAMVASGTRNARAICAVPSPATARSVSATCDGRVSVGWQQSSSSVSESSCSPAPASSAAVAGPVRAAVSTAACSRPARACSARHRSTSLREAVVISHPRGLSGTPSAGQCRAAASSASCTASSAASKSP
jgi:hypothetical protein